MSAAGIETFGSGGAANVAAALLFIQSSTNAMDVYSALNSSPWTAQSFGADPEKRKACMEYVYHSLGVTAFYNFTAAGLARSWWPILGWAIASGYMYYLYTRALRRACESGSTSWGDSGSSNGGAPTMAPAPAGSYTWSS